MTTTATAGMLAKVRALLDTADSLGENPETAEAAVNYRQRAEELMAKYKIETEELLANRKAGDPITIAPVPFDIKVCDRGQYSAFYTYLFGDVARHVGIRHTLQWSYTDGVSVYARGVGFEMDVQYAEMLFTSARLAFQTKLEPTVNPELSDQVNVYNLRSAGIERVRIADIMWSNTDKVFLGRVGRLYKAECANRGEEPALSGRGVTGAAYRENYANGFVYKMSERLRLARAGQGNGLVLGNREQVLDEAFYARFPNLRPKAEVAGSGVMASGRCSKCEKAKSGACRDHPRGRTSRGGPNYYSAAAVRGRAAGANAARSVDLGRGGGGNAVGGA